MSADIPKPPEGRRWLKVGEVIKNGDWGHLQPPLEGAWPHFGLVGLRVSGHLLHSRAIDSEPKSAPQPCQQCEAKDAEIERLGAERKGTVRLTVREASNAHELFSRAINGLSEKNYMPFLVADARAALAGLAAAIKDATK